MKVFKIMHTNRNRFDASFVKVIVLFTYWNQSVQQSIPIVQEVLFPQILKWKNRFQAFCKSHCGGSHWGTTKHGMNGIPSWLATQRRWFPSVIQAFPVVRSHDIIIGSWKPFSKWNVLLVQDDRDYCWRLWRFRFPTKARSQNILTFVASGFWMDR